MIIGLLLYLKVDLVRVKCTRITFTRFGKVVANKITTSERCAAIKTQESWGVINAASQEVPAHDIMTGDRRAAIKTRESLGVINATSQEVPARDITTGKRRAAINWTWEFRIFINVVKS